MAHNQTALRRISLMGFQLSERQGQISGEKLSLGRVCLLRLPAQGFWSAAQAAQARPVDFHHPHMHRMRTDKGVRQLAVLQQKTAGAHFRHTFFAGVANRAIQRQREQEGIIIRWHRRPTAHIAHRGILQIRQLQLTCGQPAQVAAETADIGDIYTQCVIGLDDAVLPGLDFALRRQMGGIEMGPHGAASSDSGVLQNMARLHKIA